MDPDYQEDTEDFESAYMAEPQQAYHSLPKLVKLIRSLNLSPRAMKRALRCVKKGPPENPTEIMTMALVRLMETMTIFVNEQRDHHLHNHAIIGLLRQEISDLRQEVASLQRQLADTVEENRHDMYVIRQDAYTTSSCLNDLHTKVLWHSNHDLHDAVQRAEEHMLHCPGLASLRNNKGKALASSSSSSKPAWH